MTQKFAATRLPTTLLFLTIVNSSNLKIFGNDLSHTGDAGIVLGHTLTNIEIFDNYFHDGDQPAPWRFPEPQDISLPQ